MEGSSTAFSLPDVIDLTIDPRAEAQADRRASIEAARSAIAGARSIFCDLDGCLVLGAQAANGTPEFVRRHPDKICVISNNSSLTAASCSQWLSGIGLPVPAGRIFLAGVQSVDFLRDRLPSSRRVLFVGSDELEEYALGLGLNLVDDEADCVLMAKRLSMTFGDLTRLGSMISRGASLVITNPDGWRPVEGHVPEAETGAQLAGLLALVPGAEFEVIGKPAPFLFQKALQAVGFSPGEVVMIGDNAETDAAGATAAGIRTILVNAAAGHWPLLTQGETRTST